MGAFNQRSEALFPRAGALGYVVCFPSVYPGSSVGNVGPQGLLVVRLPAPFVPHSASLGPATATRVLSAPPAGLDERLFFISLVLDFLAIPFSVSSGCARRHSVSTYAAILVLPFPFYSKWCSIAQVHTTLDDLLLREIWAVSMFLLKYT